MWIRGNPEARDVVRWSPIQDSNTDNWQSFIGGRPGYAVAANAFLGASAGELGDADWRRVM